MRILERFTSFALSFSRSRKPSGPAPLDFRCWLAPERDESLLAAAELSRSQGSIPQTLAAARTAAGPGLGVGTDIEMAWRLACAGWRHAGTRPSKALVGYCSFAAIVRRSVASDDPHVTLAFRDLFMAEARHFPERLAACRPLFDSTAAALADEACAFSEEAALLAASDAARAPRRNAL